MVRTFLAAMVLLIIASPALGKTIYFGQSNCGETGTSSSNPICDWNHLQKTVLPGDLVVFNPGTYRSNFDFRKSGQPGKPITYRGADKDQVVILGKCPSLPCEYQYWQGENAGVWVNASYINVKNFTLKRWGNIGLFIDRAHHINISNLNIFENGATSVQITDSQFITVRDSYVRDSQWGLIDSSGKWKKGQEAFTVASTTTDSTDITILRNKLENLAIDGLTTKKAKRVLIQDNVVERSCAVGIYSLEGSQIAIYRNKVRKSGRIRVPSAVNLQNFYRYRGYNPPPSFPPVGSVVDCVSLAGLPYGREQGSGISIGTCDIGGFGTTKQSDVWIAFNEVSDTLKAGIVAYDHCESRRGIPGEMDRIWIFNNSIFDAGNASSGNRAAIWLDSKVKTAVIANNAISTAESGIVDNSSISLVSNNLVHNVRLLGSQGSNLIQQDPNFVDPNLGNLDLKVSSPALGAAIPSLPGIPYLGSLGCKSSGLNIGAYLGCGEF